MTDDQILGLMRAHHRLWIAFTTEQIDKSPLSATFGRAYTALYIAALGYAPPNPAVAQ